MRRRLALGVAGLALSSAVALAGCRPTEAPRSWVDEPVPQRPNAATSLAVAASADEVTWAFGGSRRGRDSAVSLALRRDPDGRWREVPMPNLGILVGALVRGEDDVWAVGQSESEVAHFGGAGWALLPVGPPDQPVTITAFGEVGGQPWAVGAVGGRALVASWDGRRWVDLPAPDPPVIKVLAISSDAPDDVWVIASSYLDSSGVPYPTVLRWDGQHWVDTGLTTGRELRLTALSIGGAGGDVWVVGYRGIGYDTVPVAERWDGSGWTEVPVPSGPGRLLGLACVGGEPWAIGQARESLVLRYRDGGWQRLPAPPLGQFSALATLPDGRPLLVGGVALGAYRARPLLATGDL